MRTGSSDHDSSSTTSASNSSALTSNSGIVLFVVVQDRPVQIVFHVQRLDRILHQFQCLFGPGDRFVFQAVQQCVVQNATPQFGQANWSVCARTATQERSPRTYYPTNRGQKPKILPPNFRAAAARRHLAKDSACGENSLAHPKNPNRSRIPKAVCGTTAAARSNHDPTDRNRTRHTDRASIRQMGNPPVSVPKCVWRRKGIHLCARRPFDAQTVTNLPQALIVIASIFACPAFPGRNTLNFSQKFRNSNRRYAQLC